MTNRRRLGVVFVLTLGYLVVEVVGGLLSGSLALLADAGQMLTDVSGIGLALLAMRMAERAPTPERTYGFYRVEILAALTNALLLIGISAWVLFEASERFVNPPPVASAPMLFVAAAGLVVNLVGLAVLRKGAKGSLNLKGAYLEVMSDLLASIGVIVAAGLMWATDWYWLDPLVSALIGLFILPRTWFLLRDAAAILLEGTPPEVDVSRLRAAIGSVPGVDELHDLHVWTLTSGMNLLSAHVVVEDASMGAEVLRAVRDVVTQEYPISHVTVQVEERGERDCETHA